MSSVYRKLEVLSTTRKMCAGVLLFQGGAYCALCGKVDGPDVVGGAAYGTALWLAQRRRGAERHLPLVLSV
jgi:hypothetical protein